ncbi:MAG: DUF6544 family protein [Desulfobacterales bacterium]
MAGFSAAAIAYGSWRRRDSTAEIHARLEAGRLPIEGKTYRSAELAGLPEPIRRYFEAVLKDGQPMVAAVDMEQTGTFNVSETGERWRPFTSSQRIITRRPGFVWDARIRIAPGLSVRVHDAYAAGEGILHAALLGWIPLADLRGTPEAARGQLMRFLAEAACYPTALLPSQGIRWESADDHSATATLGMGETAVTMRFRFNENGLIESVRAEARGRILAGRLTPTPWEGRWSRYEQHAGILVPVEGEVSWVLPEGPRPYWRGRITRIAWEFAR